MSSLQGDAKSHKRIWLMYFPRACHHLFKRMLSGHDEFGNIELIGPMNPAYKATILLSTRVSLDDVYDECENVRTLSHNCWEQWQKTMREMESQGKRIVHSYTAFAHVTPAIHNEFLNESMNRTSGSKIDGISPSRGDQASSRSPSARSNAYWQLAPSKTSPDNPTIFPDDFLLSHSPIFLIRHPIQTFPSTIRAGSRYMQSTGPIMDDFAKLMLRYRWHVILYDWYAKEHTRDPEANPEPLILDADEMMYNRAAVAELCRRVGLDPAMTRYEWRKAQLENSYDRESEYQDVLTQSESILPGKGSDIVKLEDEIPKWKAEFGEERANLLLELVDDAMSDYEYLSERSIRNLVQDAEDDYVKLN